MPANPFGKLCGGAATVNPILSRDSEQIFLTNGIHSKLKALVLLNRAEQKPGGKTMDVDYTILSRGIWNNLIWSSGLGISLLASFIS